MTNIFLVVETKFLILYNIPVFLVSTKHIAYRTLDVFLSIHIPRKDVDSTNSRIVSFTSNWPDTLNVLCLFLNTCTCMYAFRTVVRRLFWKPVNLLQKTGGYRLTFIQSSDLYFLSIHAILLELDHQCVHINVYVVMKQIHYFTILRNVALSYSELLMIIISHRILCFRIHYQYFCFTLSQNGYEIGNTM